MHYSVLSLLLCLAESPTNTQYSPVDLDGSKLDGKILVHVCVCIHVMLSHLKILTKVL